VPGGLRLGIRLRFHNHTPQQLAIRLALHLQAADELWDNQLGGAGEEGWGESWEGLGGYWSGLDCSGHIAAPGTAIRLKPLGSWLITQGKCLLVVTAGALLVA